MWVESELVRADVAERFGSPQESANRGGHAPIPRMAPNNRQSKCIHQAFSDPPNDLKSIPISVADCQ